MAGHPVATHQQFHTSGSQASLHRLAHQRMRSAVAMAVDLDVVVDVDLDGLEAGDLVGAGRQRHQRWRIEFVEGAAAAAGQLLEGPVVERGQQRGDGLIDGRDRCEALIAQPRQDPARDDLASTRLCKKLGGRIFDGKRDRTSPLAFRVEWARLRYEGLVNQMLDLHFKIASGNTAN